MNSEVEVIDVPHPPPHTHIHSNKDFHDFWKSLPPTSTFINDATCLNMNYLPAIADAACYGFVRLECVGGLRQPA